MVTTPLKLMFFINGAENSAVSVRATMLAHGLPAHWNVQFHHRPQPKWKGISTFVQAALQFRPDIIYVLDTAYTGVIAGVVAKRLTDCKLIVDTGDVAFELAKSKGTYSQTQLALIQWTEQLALNQADHIIVRGSYHKEWLSSQGFQHIEFVPDGVDTKAVEIPDSTAFKEALNLENNLVVGLIGTMSWSDKYQMCYGWDVVEAIALLPDLPVKALLVGDGNGRAKLEQRVSELGIGDRVVFTGQVPYENLPNYLAAMDVCVSTQSNDLVGMVRTTGKLPLYLAYGKYVIATDVGEAKQVLPGIGCLLPYQGVRDENHPVRLAEHLRKLVSAPEHLKVSEQARATAKNNFDYALLSQRVEKLCPELTINTWK